jgi:hypothetical protein
MALKKLEKIGKMQYLPIGEETLIVNSKMFK